MVRQLPRAPLLLVPRSVLSTPRDLRHVLKTNRTSLSSTRPSTRRISVSSRRVARVLAGFFTWFVYFLGVISLQEPFRPIPCTHCRVRLLACQCSIKWYGTQKRGKLPSCAWWCINHYQHYVTYRKIAYGTAWTLLSYPLKVTSEYLRSA